MCYSTGCPLEGLSIIAGTEIQTAEGIEFKFQINWLNCAISRERFKFIITSSNRNVDKETLE